MNLSKQFSAEESGVTINGVWIRNAEQTRSKLSTKTRRTGTVGVRLFEF
jgi:hypothetical protein